MGHLEGDTVIGPVDKQAIVTLVERKIGFDVLAKVSNATADFVGLAIEVKLKLLNSRIKTLTVDNGKEFADNQAIDQALGSKPTLPIRIAVCSVTATRTLICCYANTFPRSSEWKMSPMKS